MSFQSSHPDAACYGFSYRGAYYHVAPGWQQLIQIYRAAQRGQIDGMSSIKLRIAWGAPTSCHLFGERTQVSRHSVRLSVAPHIEL